MRKGVWGLIGSSFQEIQGVTLGFAGVVLSFLAWVFSPNIAIPLKWYILVVVIGIVLVITLFRAIHLSDQQTAKIAKEKDEISRELQRRSIPRVASVIAVRSKLSLSLLLNPSDLFSYDTLVSLYYIENGFEILVAIGVVENIQGDGKINVNIFHILDEHQYIIDKIKARDPLTLINTRVKPNCSRKILELLA